MKHQLRIEHRSMIHFGDFRFVQGSRSEHGLLTGARGISLPTAMHCTVEKQTSGQGQPCPLFRDRQELVPVHP
jgi:hypothetical protein